MTRKSKAAANAAPATECADHAGNSKPSRKRLRTSSEVDEKPATSSPSPTSREKADTANTEATATTDASEAATEQPRQTKASVVEALLSREGGASLEALCEASGWQAHTCRAFLTGLRKKGKEVIRASDKDGKSIYLIVPKRPPVSPPAAQQASEESK